MPSNRKVYLLSAFAMTAFAVASLFSLFGYSEGAQLADVLKEFGIAVVSYGCGACMCYWFRFSTNALGAAAGTSFFGSALSFALKLVILEGENGIPYYTAAAARQQSWRPYADLVSHGVKFTVLLTVFSFLSAIVGVCATALLSNRRFASDGPGKK